MKNKMDYINVVLGNDVVIWGNVYLICVFMKIRNKNGLCC